MVLLLWWQVSLFISLLFFFLGMGMYAVMIVRYIRFKIIPMRDGRKYQIQEPYTLPNIHFEQSPFPSSSAEDNEQIQLQYPEQV
jgi:hypothetical protein